MPKISVVIPTYNRPECLRAALETLALQTFKDFEVIISDAGSPRSPINIVQGFSKRLNVRFIRQKKDIPWNQPTAKNDGIRIAHGEILFLSDDDLIYHQNCLANHHKQHHSRKRIMVFGLKYKYPPLQANQAVEYLKTRFPQGAIDLRGKWRPTSPQHNFSVRKSEVIAINGYDQDFSGHRGCDDGDFAWRLIRNGVKPIFAKECQALFIIKTYHRLDVKERRRQARHNQKLAANKKRVGKIFCAHGIR